MNPNQRSFEKTKGPTYQPVVFFILFLIANSLLSYSHLSTEVKVWIGLMFLGVPFGLALVMPDLPGPARVFSSQDPQWRIPVWIWGSIVGSAVGIRFFQLIPLSVWPMWDDAFNAFHSIQQWHHWTWKLWYTHEKVPFLFYWLEAGYFGFWEPSLYSLGSFPAVFSALTLVPGYWAFRQYFSPRLSFVCFLVLCFSFWPLFVGKFSIPACLSQFWQFIPMGVLGLYHRALGTGPRHRCAFLLGVSLGLGFYTYVVSVLTILIVIIGFFLSWERSKPFKTKDLLFLGLPLLVLSSPFLSEFLGSLKAGHVHDVSILGLSHLDPLAQMEVSLSYLAVFLWGTPQYAYDFGPVWGGFLNPVLGSAFLLGVIEVHRQKDRRFFNWIVALVLLCLMVGILSRTKEMMRVLFVMPFCVALAGIGLLRLSLFFSGWKSKSILALLLGLSVLLDGYHFLGPYHRWYTPGPQSVTAKSPERYRAYQLIERLEKGKGPGLILSDLYFNVFDQSLLVSTYPFNAAANPSLAPEKAQWAAILFSTYDQPILSRELPGAVFFPLSEGLGRPPDGTSFGVDSPDDSMSLGLVEVSAANRDRLMNWLQAHRALQAMYPDIPYHVFQPSYEGVLSRLWDLYGIFSKDPFLRVCFLEKIINFTNESSDPSGAMPFLGLPLDAIKVHPCLYRKCALVFHRLGLALVQSGDRAKARECFHRAAFFDHSYPLKKMLEKSGPEKGTLSGGPGIP